MTQPHTHTRRWIFGVAVCVALLSLTWTLMARPGGSNGKSPADRGDGARAEAGDPPGLARATERANARNRGLARAKRKFARAERRLKKRRRRLRNRRDTGVLTDITIETPAVCAYRTFIARAEVSDPTKVDEVLISGERGPRVALKAFVPGPMRITATAYTSDGRRDTLTRTIEVLECPLDDPIITVEHRPSAAEPDAILVEGAVAQGLKEPVTWTWDFGDGTTMDTGTVNRARHSYRLRPQPYRTSTFPIGVTATGSAGNTAQTHISVSLVNGARALAERGIWHLPAQYDRFPEVTDGVLRASFDVRNIDETRTMTLKDVVVHATSCAFRDKTATTRYEAAKVLDLPEVAAGGLSSGQLAITTDPKLEACRWGVEVNGSFEDGTTVMIPMAFETGAPRWVKSELSREEVKRAFRAQIERNRQQVVDEDLRPVVTP